MAKIKTFNGVKEHKVVSERQWLVARKKFLAEEKKFTKLRDKLNQHRRNLPWVKIEKEYVFEGPDGQETLADLFCGKSQLVVIHFMFGAGWGEGCAHCSFWADHYESTLPHLAQRDTALVVVSHAPLKEITPFKKRMGWKFKWLSSANSDFNYDFYVSFTPEQIRTGNIFYNYGITKMKIEEREGASTFYRDAKGAVYHTYSTYERGLDMFNLTYHLLDMTAKGRDENPKHPQDWVNYHDKYKSRAKC